MEYIRSLDPDGDDDLSGFTKQWLADVCQHLSFFLLNSHQLQEYAPWPLSSQLRMQLFMHDSSSYISSHGQEEDQTPRSIKFANALRLGTEISDISPKEISTYLRRFCEQVKVLSIRLTGYPTFVLEHLLLEGTIRKTVRFERMWARKEEHWATRPRSATEDTRPTKRRMKESDVVRSIMFDQTSQGDLVHAAAVALELHNASLGSATPKYAEQHTVSIPAVYLSSPG
jgi:hypothetical protein